VYIGVEPAPHKYTFTNLHRVMHLEDGACQARDLPPLMEWTFAADLLERFTLDSTG
jgi:hypothetical protein